jgi:acyl carrier protein
MTSTAPRAKASTDLRTRIRKFVIDTFRYGDASGFRDDLQLLDAGIIDSTGILEVITFVEGELGLRVADREVVPEHFGSVDLLVRFVESKRAAR